MTATDIILATLYSGAVSWLIFKLPFFKEFGLPAKYVAALFLLKVITGITYGLLHAHLYSGGDTFSYFNESKIILSALPDHPGHFFRLTFWYTVKPPPADLAPYEAQMIYWNIVNSYFMVRLNVLMNLLSFQHYYVNVVIYNFLTLTGILYLFRWLYEQVLPDKPMLILLLVIFPSVAFWSSGMHKDGIALSAIGIILYHFQKLMVKRSWRTAVLFFFGTWLLFMVRNYLLLLLLPCLLAYAMAIKYTNYRLLYSLAAFSGCYIILLNLHHLNPAFNLTARMAQQQQEFASIASTVTLPMHTLDETPSSLLPAMPVALSNCLTRPWIINTHSFYQIPFAIDNLLVLSLSVLALFTYKRNLQAAVLIFCLLFALSVFLFTGSVVPNLGALLRYKMPGMLFLAVALLSMTDTSRIRRWFVQN